MTVTAGLILSGSYLGEAARKNGAAEYAYVTLFLLLTSVGAQADLRAITQAPAFMAAGLIVLIIHFAILVIVCRLLKLPSFC